MELTKETIGEVCVCRISGCLDSQVADELRSRLHQADPGGDGPVVVNLAGVGFIGSACLGALIAFRNRAGKGRKIVVCGLSVPIHKMFKFAALDKIFPIAATEADALLQARQA